MKLSNDLHSCGIPYSCDQCIMKQSCSRYGYNCVSFYPENMDAFLQNVLDYFTETITPSKDKRLKRHVGRVNNDNGITYDDVTVLDEYYVRMINDTLLQIRQGGTGYLFTISQIKDLFRFEQNICVKYVDGCFAISKRKLQKEEL